MESAERVLAKAQADPKVIKAAKTKKPRGRGRQAAAPEPSAPADKTKDAAGGSQTHEQGGKGEDSEPSKANPPQTTTEQEASLMDKWLEKENYSSWSSKTKNILISFSIPKQVKQ